MTQKQNTTKKKEEIRARLTVNGIGQMSAQEWRFFVKWVRMMADEFAREKKDIFNQKRFRHTLYKPLPITPKKYK